MTAPGDDHDTSESGRVGFRDIYRAVGESETRIKEHISLVLMPISTQIADHEVRIVALESASLLSIAQAATDRGRGLERKRIGDISGKTLAMLILAGNFIMGLIIFFANLATAAK